MGCGKSSVAKLLEHRGYRRLDSDEIVRSDLLCRTDVIADVRRRFGEGVIDVEGRVHRGRLAARVFADDADRQALEDLVNVHQVSQFLFSSARTRSRSLFN